MSILLTCIMSLISWPQALAAAPAAPKNYISYELPFKPYEKIRRQLEKKLKIKLKHRSEAHITVVTPPEFEKLTQKIDIDKIQALSEEFLKSKPTFKIICTGLGSITLNGQTEKTFYIVVTSEALLKYRQKLASLIGISKEIFNPDTYYPHITLGYTLRDLHLEDGVIKDARSCLK